MQRTVILVEGDSDRVALETLAARLGRDLASEQVQVVALQGATNVGSWLEQHRDALDGVRLAGLYDAPEERWFRRGLERVGRGPVPDRASLERHGFHACVEDLEDELIRALGHERVLAVIEEHGELASLRILQHQPEHRVRSERAHLRRFIGVRSGRKAVYARLLVEALELDRVPTPLLAVLG